MKLSGIDKLKNVIDNQQIECINEMYNFIDKVETIQECCIDDKTICDMYIEQLFFEYVSPDKDEITKWMNKKGYFYNGDKANKKKETMRMYQFLKQHKFDPKDETYESNIKDKNGGNKRIKLNIDPSDDSTKDVSLLNAAVRNGNNAYYYTGDKSINMGSKMLKGKQHVSQIVLKHEEGHADSFNRSADGKSGVNENLPADHPANRALDEHKKAGKFVNKHDDSSEELMADLYAAMNGSIRTKNWGKNKTTRKITANDIKRKFMKSVDRAMHRIEKETESDVEIIKMLSNKSKIDKEIDSLSKKIVDLVKEYEKKYGKKSNDDKVVNTGAFNTGVVVIDDDDDEWDEYAVITESSGSLNPANIVYNMSSDIYRIIDSELTFIVYTDGTLDMENIAINNNIIKKAINDINSLKKEIETYKQTMTDILNVFKNNKISDISAIQDRIKDKTTSKFISDIFRISTNVEDIIENFDKMLSDKLAMMNDLTDTLNARKKSQSKQNKHLRNVYKYIKNGVKMLSTKGKFPDNFKSQLVAEVTMMCNEYVEKEKKTIEAKINKLKQDCVDTNELRIKFAQTAIKEYFEELFDNNDFYYD